MTAAPPPPAPVRSVFGRSVEGRPLRVVRIGRPDAQNRVLVVGVVHGTERAGRPILAALERRGAPRGTAYWLVPSLNPDGERRGRRQNAHGVDLNRNFPRAWRPTGAPGSTYYAGPRPASEPETRALMRLVRRVRPTAAVWYHQHLRLVYRQGGARPGLVARYARRTGLPLRRSPDLPGTAIRWENALGGTAWVVELAAGTPTRATVARHVRALRAL